MTIDINLTYIFIFIVIGIVIFLLHNLGGLKLFSSHDKDMNKIWLEKFPLVKPDFYRKPQIEQTIENNQEIHEINKRLDKQEIEISELKKQINKLIEVIERLKNE